ncbi:DUF4442 domain-containing protein [Corynebacterium sanguinis]|uniref:DUF4442 domain-containing protein n=1 Tax=Corynebacterium sanguinis TaxID=2594913 RepID=A0A838WW09_9CORY|nr:hotdog fold domain-containing protein [Corynebacterium sanguinis]MBA4504945.1 DUF4442 domain-containing protein [Corynebacterium sanguinis]MCT1412351.1 DUF4442 domain-containing protein [Corynebacterium sanguinis]MCT1414617.1 DUF4442 domain-containing protein [Corynebacterium sanguinis]MCT1444485.1 DUF4442 domain-containing protein [Corynebacterium sanguinis]MCT1492019.1 DUF4442 domain-containing protein [Corynebacterium sanguinis]
MTFTAHAATPNQIAKLWERVSASPVKRGLFSAFYALKAPYFRTVLPRIQELVPGSHCTVRIPKWWGVNNHIGTFHAIAALNGAEAAMGLLAEATVPPTHRWIPRGMHADYPAKSTGGLTVTAAAQWPDFSTITRDSGGQLVTVACTLVDDAGTTAVTADIDIWISKRS